MRGAAKMCQNSENVWRSLRKGEKFLQKKNKNKNSWRKGKGEISERRDDDAVEDDGHTRLFFFRKKSRETQLAGKGAAGG